MDKIKRPSITISGDDDGGQPVGNPVTFQPTSNTCQFNDSDPSWLVIAKGELGVSEKPGAAIEKRIVEYHLTTTLGATDDAVPWCASFVCWCLEQAGYKHPRSARAVSFSGYGEQVNEPHPGCIVVTKRKGGYHVGFFIEKTAFGFKMLGGNQSDKVCIKEFADSQVVAIRIPSNLTNDDDARIA